MGLALFLIPATVSVMFSEAGAPALDVYVFSAFSCLGVPAWSWYKRALFRVSDQSLQEASEQQPGSLQEISFLRSYTVILILLGSVAVLLLARRIFVVTRGIDASSGPVALDMFLVPSYIFLALGCWTAGFLRARRSQYGLAATGAINFLLIWIPFGTAAFIYWIGWVRKKELTL